MAGNASDVTFGGVVPSLNNTLGGSIALAYSNQGSPKQRAEAIQKWIAERLTAQQFQSAKMVMESDGTVFLWYVQ